MILIETLECNVSVIQYLSNIEKTFAISTNSVCFWLVVRKLTARLCNLRLFSNSMKAVKIENAYWEYLLEKITTQYKILNKIFWIFIIIMGILPAQLKRLIKLVYSINSLQAAKAEK